MARKEEVVSLPLDLLDRLDASADSIGVTRVKFITDVLRGSCALVGKLASADLATTIPISIGIPIQSVHDYQAAAKILGTTASDLIACSLEIGRRANVDLAREYEETKGLCAEDEKVH